LKRNNLAYLTRDLSRFFIGKACPAMAGSMIIKGSFYAELPDKLNSLNQLSNLKT